MPGAFYPTAGVRSCTSISHAFGVVPVAAASRSQTVYLRTSSMKSKRNRSATRAEDQRPALALNAYSS